MKVPIKELRTIEKLKFSIQKHISYHGFVIIKNMNAVGASSNNFTDMQKTRKKVLTGLGLVTTAISLGACNSTDKTEADKSKPALSAKDKSKIHNKTTEQKTTEKNDNSSTNNKTDGNSTDILGLGLNSEEEAKLINSLVTGKKADPQTQNIIMLKRAMNSLKGQNPAKENNPPKANKTPKLLNTPAPQKAIKITATTRLRKGKAFIFTKGEQSFQGTVMSQFKVKEKGEVRMILMLRAFETNGSFRTKVIPQDGTWSYQSK